MEIFLLVAHAILAILILTLVLLQQGKGAEMGASFGAGASQTLFGSQGSGSFFFKLTALVMALFFATSLGLTVVAKNKAAFSSEDEAFLPLIQDQKDQVPELPAIGTQSIEQSVDKPVDRKLLDKQSSVNENSIKDQNPIDQKIDSEQNSDIPAK